MRPWDMFWHLQNIAIWFILGGAAFMCFLCFARRPRSMSGRKTESPEEALKRRYVEGEIDENTYDHMREKLAEGGITSREAEITPQAERHQERQITPPPPRPTGTA